MELLLSTADPPVHLTPAFSYLGYAEGSFPHSEQGAAEILSLPLYPQITAATDIAEVGCVLPEVEACARELFAAKYGQT